MKAMTMIRRPLAKLIQAEVQVRPMAKLIQKEVQALPSDVGVLIKFTTQSHASSVDFLGLNVVSPSELQ